MRREAVVATAMFALTACASDRASRKPSEPVVPGEEPQGPSAEPEARGDDAADGDSFATRPVPPAGTLLVPPPCPGESVLRRQDQRYVEAGDRLIRELHFPRGAAWSPDDELVRAAREVCALDPEALERAELERAIRRALVASDAPFLNDALKEVWFAEEATHKADSLARVRAITGLDQCALEDALADA